MYGCLFQLEIFPGLAFGLSGNVSTVLRWLDVSKRPEALSGQLFQALVIPI